MKYPINKLVKISDLIENGKTKSNTFSINSAKWIEQFGVNETAAEEERLAIDSSGCYCFWFKGTAKELQEYNRPHWIKGKQTRLDDSRLPCKTSKIVCTGLRKKYKSDPPIYRPVYHLYHCIDWVFKEFKDELGHTYIPLYVGKTSHLFDRINSHFNWSGQVKMWETVNEVVVKESIVCSTSRIKLERVLKPDKNTTAQFRAGFKFLSESLSDYSREKPLDLGSQIYIEVYKSPFEAVSDRFYEEIRLIADLCPPFNVDSER